MHEMKDITDSSCVFIPKQFFKALAYHILWGLMGPFSALIILCFETKIYIQNLGFIPSNKASVLLTGLFYAQSMPVVIYLVPLILFLKEQYEIVVLEEMKDRTLSPFILIAVTVNLLLRYFVICVRSGTTPIPHFLRQSKRLYTQDDLREVLMLLGWLELSPQTIMIEIHKAMANVGVSKKHFTLRTLTPVYPLY